MRTANWVSKVKASLGCLHDLEDSQLEVTLLHSCLSLPKVSRCCPPPYLIQAAEGLDSAMRETLEVITGAPVTDWSWLKASLPSSLGGLNLRSAVLHAPAAFVASLHNSQPLIEEMLGFSPSTLQPLNDVPFPPPWDSTSMTLSSGVASDTGWGCPSIVLPTRAQNVGERPMPLGTIK